MSQMSPARSLHYPLQISRSHSSTGQDPLGEQTKPSAQLAAVHEATGLEKHIPHLQEPFQRTPIGCNPRSFHDDGNDLGITTPPSSPKSAEEIWDEAEARARRKERRQADIRKARRRVFTEGLMADLRADMERSLGPANPVPTSSTKHSQVKGVEASVMDSLGAAQEALMKLSTHVVQSQPLGIQQYQNPMPSSSPYENSASIRSASAGAQKIQTQNHQPRIKSAQSQPLNRTGSPPTTPPRSRQNESVGTSAASRYAIRPHCDPPFGRAVPLQTLQTSPTASCRSGETLVEILPEPTSPTAAAHRALYSLQQYISVFEKDDDDDPKTGLIGHLKWPLHVSRGSFSGEKDRQGSKRGVVKRWMLRVLSCGCASRNS